MCVAEHETVSEDEQDEGIVKEYEFRDESLPIEEARAPGPMDQYEGIITEELIGQQAIDLLSKQICNCITSGKLKTFTEYVEGLEKAPCRIYAEFLK